MKKSIALLAFLCSLKCFSQQNAGSAKDDIMKVVSTYFNCILNKDSVTFCNLFALDSVSFFGVNAPDSYQFYSKKNPKTRILLKDNYRSFIRFVVSSKVKAEEKYNNVTIWNDNTIATLSFNYSFWIGGKETNWGIETWQLLFNGKEWKIMSALFSANDEQVTPDPTQTKNQ
jgi:hypothetical protein